MVQTGNNMYGVGFHWFCMVPRFRVKYGSRPNGTDDIAPHPSLHKGKQFKSNNKRIDFDPFVKHFLFTHRRRHQKSKTGVPVAPKKDMCPPKTFKKNKNKTKNHFLFRRVPSGYLLSCR